MVINCNELSPKESVRSEILWRRVKLVSVPSPSVRMGILSLFRRWIFSRIFSSSVSPLPSDFNTRDLAGIFNYFCWLFHSIFHKQNKNMPSGKVCLVGEPSVRKTIMRAIFLLRGNLLDSSATVMASIDQPLIYTEHKHVWIIFSLKSSI